MADPAKRIYWDSCAWIGLINNEPDKAHPLRSIWEDAKAGRYEIWTSVYAYLEVIKGKAEHGDPYPPEESDRTFEQMVEQPYVQRVQLDIPIARHARALRRAFNDKGLKSRPDAIHLATATYWNLEEFHTWDKKHLLDLNGHVRCENGSSILIRIPGPEVMGPLFALPSAEPRQVEAEPPPTGQLALEQHEENDPEN